MFLYEGTLEKIITKENFMAIREKHDAVFFKSRRERLAESIKKKYADASKGIILLLGAFESKNSFRQESSFYYFTGIQEPASALTIDLQPAKTLLYVPNFGNERQKWMSSTILPGQSERFGFDEIRPLGEQSAGYQCHPFFSKNEYAELIAHIQQAVAEKRAIFTLNPSTSAGYVEQRFILMRMMQMVPGLAERLVDISAEVAQLRRSKSQAEIECLYQAIDVTVDAHDAAARAISPGKKECEIQALIEYMFTVRGCSTAFPSIVATGKNATILHYHDNSASLANGELMVVDVGASYRYYNADLTRTYPVSGTFSKRQRELYMIVLETQEFIAQLAKPGFWVSNKDVPEKSLYHRALAFLKEKGYERYFTHGIGHYLGLDVHDVGSYTEPLKSGDVITIEPGIYIPEEKIGIRIEDNYWIVEDGAICLSEDLPKSPEDIELMMATKFDDEEDEIDDQLEADKSEEYETEDDVEN